MKHLIIIVWENEEMNTKFVDRRGFKTIEKAEEHIKYCKDKFYSSIKLEAILTFVMIEE